MFWALNIDIKEPVSVLGSLSLPYVFNKVYILCYISMAYYQNSLSMFYINLVCICDIYKCIYIYISHSI